MLTVDTLLRQDQTNWCWAAVVQMLQRHFNLNEAQQCAIAGDKLRTKCCEAPIPGRCNVSHLMAEFAELLQHHRIRSTLVSPSGPLSEALLVEQLQRDEPVPVVVGWIWDADATTGHFVLAFQRPKTGTKKPHKRFYWVADPFEGLRCFAYEALVRPVGGAWGWTWYNLEVIA